TELADSPAVTRISPEQIIAERQAAQAKLQQGEIPDSPMDAATTDVISSDSFNSMSLKLEAAMKEVMAKKDVQKDRPAGPDDSDKKRTDSKVKAPDDLTQAEPEPEHITGAKAADWKKLKEARAAAEK